MQRILFFCYLPPDSCECSAGTALNHSYFILSFDSSHSKTRTWRSILALMANLTCRLVVPNFVQTSMRYDARDFRHPIRKAHERHWSNFGSADCYLADFNDPHRTAPIAGSDAAINLISTIDKTGHASNYN